MQIDILIFDGFDDLDALGPNELLRHARRAGAPFEVSLVDLDGAERVISGLGTTLIPDGQLSERPDLVIVPGGGAQRGSPVGVLARSSAARSRRALARLHADGVAIASVCTGALLLAAAGLLEGRPATTNRLALDRLRETGAEVIDDARRRRRRHHHRRRRHRRARPGAVARRARAGRGVRGRSPRRVEYERTGTVWRSERASA